MCHDNEAPGDDRQRSISLERGYENHSGEWQRRNNQSYRDLWGKMRALAKEPWFANGSHSRKLAAAPEVRVMDSDADGKVTVQPPYTDPKGMGFTATLTEIFGLPTSLDAATQRMVDDRNALARLDSRTAREARRLIEINDQLDRLGFMFEDREPLYQGFLRAWQDFRYSDMPPLSQEQLERRRQAMKALIQELAAKQASPS